MPTELEIRLERALRTVPEAADATRERARRTALEALVPVPQARRRIGPRVIAAVAAAACLVTAGAAIASGGSVRLPAVVADQVVGASAPKPAATLPVALPAGTAAVALTIDGRTWNIGAQGPKRVPGRLSALALSPGDLYALEASAHRLRAVASHSGRVAFSNHVAGRVIAAAWSPLPIRIAYIAQTARGNVMHDMWGTGSHDRSSPGRAAPVAPTWRWDSLAVAYVRANGQVAVLSPAAGTTQTLGRPCGIALPQTIAYGPSNNLLAVAGSHRLAVVDTTGSAPVRCLNHPAGTVSLAWVGGHRLALGAGSTLQMVSTGWAGLEATGHTVPGVITALAAAPHGHGLAVAVQEAAGTAVMLSTAAGTVGKRALARLSGRHGSTTLQWR